MTGSDDKQAPIALERVQGPASVLGGATVLLATAVAVSCHGREFVIVAASAEVAADIASYLMDGVVPDMRHCHRVAMCQAAEMRTASKPNGLS